MANCISCSVVCKIVFCSEFPDIPDKAGKVTRRTRRRRRRTQAIAKRYAFHANAIRLPQQQIKLIFWYTSVRIYDAKLSVNCSIIELIPFSNVYNQIHKRADVIWKYRRYKLIHDYENRPPLPPPIIAFYFFYWIVLKLCYYVCGTDSQRRIINKQYTDERDLEIFEKHCLKALMRDTAPKSDGTVEGEMAIVSHRVGECNSKLTHSTTGINKRIVKNHESIAKLEALVEDLQEKVDRAANIGEGLQKKVDQEVKIGDKLLNIVEEESFYIKGVETSFQKKLDRIEEKIVATLERLEEKINAHHELAD